MHLSGSALSVSLTALKVVEKANVSELVAKHRAYLLGEQVPRKSCDAIENDVAQSLANWRRSALQTERFKNGLRPKSQLVYLNLKSLN